MTVIRYDWHELYTELANCSKCRLCEQRTNVVIADGDPHARIMFIGEGPGREEDVSGVPFVGAAGRLFNRLLEEAGLVRSEVYICNVVKCRPPQNRDPLPDEAAACLPYLRAQVALVHPRVIICLGKVAAGYIYDPSIQISRQRGCVKQVKSFCIVPTYHPAALLRNESWINDFVADLMTAKKLSLSEEGF